MAEQEKEYEIVGEKFHVQDTHDLTKEFILMCDRSENLQKDAVKRYEMSVRSPYEIFVKDKEIISKVIWIPNQRQLQEVLGVTDQLPSDEFLVLITELFENLKKTTKNFPWINSIEKALIHYYMEKTENKFWNIKYKVWELIP